MIIGGLARVLRGSDELARGVDIWPALTANNNERLAQTGLELDSHVGDRRRRTVEEIALAGEDVVELRTSAGELKLISAPAGVPNGFADLRRAATREDLGNRLRPLVASTADLARMTAALRREQDIERLRELRRVMELEVEREPVAPLEVQSPPELTRGPRQWARLRERDNERGMER